MNHPLSVIVTILACVLVGAIVLSPSWPVVVALVVLLLVSALVGAIIASQETERLDIAMKRYCADLDAAKDTRLDASGRADAKRSAETLELVLDRYKKMEESVLILRQQVGSHSAMPGMSPFRKVP